MNISALIIPLVSCVMYSGVQFLDTTMVNIRYLSYNAINTSIDEIKKSLDDGLISAPMQRLLKLSNAWVDLINKIILIKEDQEKALMQSLNVQNLLSDVDNIFVYSIEYRRTIYQKFYYELAHCITEQSFKRIALDIVFSYAHITFYDSVGIAYNMLKFS